MAGIVGIAAFLYQVPASIANPTNIQWMMVGDRGAALAGWLFERQSPWTLPFGVLHNMIPPLVTTVGYQDGLPLIAVPAKLVSGWTPLPWQYSGTFLLASYVLQGVFGYLVLRTLGVRRVLALVGAAFFATSPALLERFEHITLSAHWVILAAWWLYLPPTASRPGWRFLALWLLLLAIAIPIYVYLALMVAVLACAAYGRAVWVDRSLSLWAAGWQGAVAVAVVFGVLWIFGILRGALPGRQRIWDVFDGCTRFFRTRSMVIAYYTRQCFSWRTEGYENYYFLGSGWLCWCRSRWASRSHKAPRHTRPRRLVTTRERQPQRAAKPPTSPVRVSGCCLVW